jgi:hypothetical protein
VVLAGSGGVLDPAGMGEGVDGLHPLIPFSLLHSPIKSSLTIRISQSWRLLPLSFPISIGPLKYSLRPLSWALLARPKTRRACYWYSTPFKVSFAVRESKQR